MKLQFILARKYHLLWPIIMLTLVPPIDGLEPDSDSPGWLASGAIQYQSEVRRIPRPLALHWLVIDLADEDYELAVAVGADPDGAGPVEAQLTPPSQLAATADFVVAVNTNPWIMVPCPGTDTKAGYVVGGCCDISGWVREEARTHSPVDKSHWSFWIDARRLAQLGPIAQDCPARCSVAGFGGLLDDGRVLPRPSDVRHPRTALGLDPSGRWLTLLVVDGRQPGYSEGVSLHELAQMMRGAGCWRALNLDGGGSSVMLAADGSQGYQMLNRPSDRQGPRPIPVMLGIRHR
jgi:hypothetical protein